MINKDLCTGCMNCTAACMSEHNGVCKSIYKLDLDSIESESRNHISLDFLERPVPVFCRHCKEPECVITCMSKAMTKDKRTGIVSYDETKCASCFMCILSCPFGVLKSDRKTRKVILKCDMCGGREIPRCVENCPTGAIYLAEVDD